MTSEGSDGTPQDKPEAGPALTLDETAEVLANMRLDLNEEVISKTRRGIESGTPDEIQIRRLLAEFVRRAPGIRKYMGYGYTPDLVEFVASRVESFLSGGEPDLMKAFGLTMKRRGPKASTEARKRQLVVAAEVLELMKQGKTLDVACEVIAEARSINTSTARNWYSWHKDEAANLLLYRHLLRPSQTSDDWALDDE